YETFGSSLDSPHLCHSDTRLHLQSVCGTSKLRRRYSVCLCSCNNPGGILDVCRRSFRGDWRWGIARCISTVWNWHRAPESGRAIHRAEDLVGDSSATFKVIGQKRDFKALKTLM